MNTRIILQGTTVLALMFFIGSSCSDNSAQKAQIAQMQAQMQAQQQQFQMQQQFNAALATQKNTGYDICMSAGGNPETCAKNKN